MSSQELYEWYEYYNEEPFMADRIEIQMAILCDIAGSFGGSKLKHEDYMICKASKQKESTVSLESQVLALFK